VDDRLRVLRLEEERIRVQSESLHNSIREQQEMASKMHQKELDMKRKADEMQVIQQQLLRYQDSAREAQAARQNGEADFLKKSEDLTHRLEELEKFESDLQAREAEIQLYEQNLEADREAVRSEQGNIIRDRKQLEAQHQLLQAQKAEVESLRHAQINEAAALDVQIKAKRELQAENERAIKELEENTSALRKLQAKQSNDLAIIEARSE
jgi:hypothetical protein